MSPTDLMYFAARCRSMAQREHDPRMRLALLQMAVGYDARKALKVSLQPNLAPSPT
jgi:hypothetical protein